MKVKSVNAKPPVETFTIIVVVGDDPQRQAALARRLHALAALVETGEPGQTHGYMAVVRGALHSFEDDDPCLFINSDDHRE